MCANYPDPPTVRGYPLSQIPVTRHSMCVTHATTCDCVQILQLTKFVVSFGLALRQCYLYSMPVRGSPPDPLSCRHHPSTQYDKGPPRTDVSAPSQRLGTAQLVRTPKQSTLYKSNSLTIFPGTHAASIHVGLRLSDRLMPIHHIAECAAIQ